MLKTVALLNIFLETVIILFQNSLIKRTFKRKYIFNKKSSWP